MYSNRAIQLERGTSSGALAPGRGERGDASQSASPSRGHAAPHFDPPRHTGRALRWTPATGSTPQPRSPRSTWRSPTCLTRLTLARADIPSRKHARPPQQRRGLPAHARCFFMCVRAAGSPQPKPRAPQALPQWTRCRSHSTSARCARLNDKLWPPRKRAQKKSRDVSPGPFRTRERVTPRPLTHARAAGTGGGAHQGRPRARRGPYNETGGTAGHGPGETPRCHPQPSSGQSRSRAGTPHPTTEVI